MLTTVRLLRRRPTAALQHCRRCLHPAAVDTPATAPSEPADAEGATGARPWGDGTNWAGGDNNDSHHQRLMELVHEGDASGVQHLLKTLPKARALRLHASTLVNRRSAADSTGTRTGTALWWAAANGDAKIVRLLIEAGASVEPGKGRNMGKWVELGRRADGGTVRRESAHRWTALHRAAIGPHGAQRTHAALCHDGRAWADVAMALLAAGADPLRADAHGVRRILPSPPN